MAPMKKNRNRDQKKVSGRRRGKNSSCKTCKCSGSSDDSRIKKRIAGYKLETTVGRNRNVKFRKMGAGRYSKMPKDGNRRSSDSDELRTIKYIQKALELGLSSGYLIPDENSDGQVLRVASEIVKFGRSAKDESESDEKLDDPPTKRRGRVGRANERTTAGKRLATKNGRTNIRKRGRSRTQSPKRPVAEKRQRKRSNSRAKVKARVQKRKRLPEGKSNARRRRKNENKAKDDDDDDDADDDDDNDEGQDDDDEDRDDNNRDNEPDKKENENKNSSDGNKKLPVAGRPGTSVPNSENNPPTSVKEKNEGKEASGDERSSEEGDEDDEEVDDQEQPEGMMAEEDFNEDNEEQRAQD